MSKTYSTKSNAVRAARNAGIEKFNIEKVDGRFVIVPVVTLVPSAIRHVSEVTRPCSLVAEICWANPEATRKQLMTLCEEAGIAFYTARTQIQKYKVRAA